ncbi:hypothetical protein LZG04_34255 [Saccharothrix sp. S26]|uniref:NERD domain-containing protein n=1 Tax=Saccharothrix sp. S26 TaxID=2907215 RepID=UPI001F465DCE|nr:NERD domain-containing protein [Saccharothrix sp. S26]MCE6999840.1 hypothetical protein [Saccharothrix sp. S26]
MEGRRVESAGRTSSRAGDGITQSAFTHERAALRQVRELLPDRHSYEAWSDCTSTSPHGHIREVDLPVATPSGLHRVEVESLRCRVENRHGTWVRARRT